MSEEIRNVAYIFSYVSFPNNARHFILLILIATYYNNQHLTSPNHSLLLFIWMSIVKALTLPIIAIVPSLQNIKLYLFKKRIDAAKMR